MKTLIWNGSPRKQGDTVSLINKVTEELIGEYFIVNAYDSEINPCIDCRYCWSNPGCSIKDGMQKVYEYIEDCDNILIASPIYFSELTGALLNVGSRLQTYFCAGFFRKEKLKIKAKKGAVLLVGGGDGNVNKAYGTACCLLHHMNTFDILPAVVCHNTNNIPAIEDETALLGASDIAKYFNEGRTELAIEREDINSPEAYELMDELSEELEKITGSSGRGSFDNSEINNPRSLFVITRADGVAVGCGAIRELSNDTAEVKRMYARKKSCGIGNKILSYLELQAKELGYQRIVLETRKCNTNAVNFYLKNGYQVINNYGKYVNMTEAICFEKKL